MRPADPAERVQPPWDRLEELETYRLLCRARLDHLVEVREPLVLISQVQRSGGTLLSQLLDGHPECHAHPPELHLADKRDSWPRLDLDRQDSWFGTLFETNVETHLVRGYRRKSQHGGELDTLPFLFSARLQQDIFDLCVAARSIESERDVFDCYFTSYFNAWLDNQNLYTVPKKVVTGFTPRMAMDPSNLERFFAAYPGGVLVSIVREPRSWYASARAHKQEYRKVDSALETWRLSGEATLAAASRYGDRVLVVTYDQLVRTTKTTMRRVADRIGISMAPALLTPTFNGCPIRANSTHAVGRYGILQDRSDAYKTVLDAETILRIDELAGDVYPRAVAAVTQSP